VELGPALEGASQRWERRRGTVDTGVRPGRRAGESQADQGEEDGEDERKSAKSTIRRPSRRLERRKQKSLETVGSVARPIWRLDDGPGVGTPAGRPSRRDPAPAGALVVGLATVKFRCTAENRDRTRLALGRQ
jgi:hypothetical protein